VRTLFNWRNAVGGGLSRRGAGGLLREQDRRAVRADDSDTYLSLLLTTTDRTKDLRSGVGDKIGFAYVSRVDYSITYRRWPPTEHFYNVSLCAISL